MLKNLDCTRLQSEMNSQGFGITALATQACVSRAQLSRILGQREASVRDATVEAIARALKLEPDEILVGGSLGRYKRWVRDQFANVDFRGMGLPGLNRQAIGDVFVDVDTEDVSRKCAGDADEDCVSRAALRDRKTDAQPPLPATDCISSHDRIVLTGDPGSGKTTVLRYLAWRGAEPGNREMTPIYVRLPEFCRAKQLDSHADLVAVVAARAAADGCGDLDTALRQELEDKHRHCLVLLDGLDEVGKDEDRRLLVEAIQAFIDRYPRNRFVVTSRSIGFAPTVWQRAGFSIVRVLPYSAKRLHEFAEKWTAIFSHSPAKRSAEIRGTIETAIFSNPRVRALAANPLMLTILVLLNEARGGALPRRRVDLYEKVVDVFLDTWESNKRSTGTFEDMRDIDLDAREFRWLLADLSLAMQKADRTLAPRWWLAERMQQYLQQQLGFEPEAAKDACDRILRYLAERAGLIEERGLDVFGFSHRTLQEYFASLGVRDEAEAAPSRDVTSGVRNYLYHPQWSEVVRLLAAQLTPPLAESLIATILDDPDPLGRFLHRGAKLTLGCLADGTTVPNRHLVTQAFRAVADLGRTRWRRITLEVLDLLDAFEGTRLAELAGRTRAAILETPKTDLNEEDCVCRDVRRAGVWALEPRLGNSAETNATFRAWLDDPQCPALQQAAAQALARAIANERLPWDHRTVEKIEAILMHVTNPCPCAWDSLQELADARAVRHGLRLEAVLRDALQPLGSRVELAFVFGSTARNRQNAESDIDLFVLGDVSLKLLAGPLRQAENTLGRRISPVIHTRDSFRKKYAAGDPFLLDVYRREKVPVLLPDQRTSREDLDDELRTMVAERMAATQ